MKELLLFVYRNYIFSISCLLGVIVACLLVAMDILTFSAVYGAIIGAIIFFIRDTVIYFFCPRL
jgi:hypothetical protein